MRRLIDTLRARFGCLRCRPGDVCWVVRDIPEPQVVGGIAIRGGTVVTVTRLSDGDKWILETPLPIAVHWFFWVRPGQIVAIADELLIPLRDRPGADQSLAWGRKPAGRPLTAPRPVPLPTEAGAATTSAQPAGQALAGLWQQFADAAPRV